MPPTQVTEWGRCHGGTGNGFSNCQRPVVRGHVAERVLCWIVGLRCFWCERLRQGSKRAHNLEDFCYLWGTKKKFKRVMHGVTVFQSELSYFYRLERQRMTIVVKLGLSFFKNIWRLTQKNQVLLEVVKTARFWDVKNETMINHIRTFASLKG